jgi:hypothetical protein
MRKIGQEIWVIVEEHIPGKSNGLAPATAGHEYSSPDRIGRAGGRPTHSTRFASGRERIVQHHRFPAQVTSNK